MNTVLQFLQRSRPGRHRWVYVPPAVLYWIAMHSLGHPPSNLVVAIPIAVVLIQIAYPTVVLWLIISVSFLGLILLLIEAVGNFWGGVLIFLMICTLALMYIFRPQAER